MNFPEPPFPSSWPQPRPQEFTGRFINLAPLNVEEDMDELWEISHATDQALEIWRYLPRGPFAGVAEMRAYCRGWQAQPDVVAFTVRENATRRCVGGISIMSIRPEHGVAEVGFIWYAPSAQRTKTNTETNYLLLRHCFEELRYRRMEWKCNASNERSQRAASRLGFQYEGTFRQHMIVKGLNRDTAWFSMLDHEWPEHRTALERWLYEDDSKPLADLRDLRSGENSDSR